MGRSAQLGPPAYLSLTRRYSGRALSGPWNCLLPPVASLRASLSCRRSPCWLAPCNFLPAGTVLGEYRGFSFASVSTRSWLALGYLIIFAQSSPSRLQLAPRALLPPTLVATHTYVNPIVAVYLAGFSPPKPSP